MDLELTGKRVLVTGSSSGIGASIAETLAGEGCAVVVHGRNAERAEAVAARIGAQGVAIGDLATDEGAEAVFAQTRQALGGDIEILINNAGGAPSTGATPWLDLSIEDWNDVYQSNPLAAVRLIRLAVPGMREAGWGRIIQIGSAVSAEPHAIGSHYCAAKAATVNMTVSLSRALAGTGITVNTVSPGGVVTPAWDKYSKTLAKEHGWDHLSDAEIEGRIATELYELPVGRLGRVEDIAFAVCFVASPRGGNIHGANIRVDGGQVKSIN